jgi:hypothetical protein
MSGAHDDLIADLWRLAELIDERALDTLREAVASGAAKRPDSDRYLTQARRAVEKAIHALERAGGAADTAGDDD